jgi:hypothetical protein
MTKRLWAAILLLWSSTAGQAAEWWCVAVSAGGAPNRILGYVDLDTVRPGANGAIEVWGLIIFESPLTNGERFRQVHYAFKCREQHAATLGGASYDSRWNAMPDLEVGAVPYRPADDGSIEDLAMRMACRMPTNRGVPVPDPVQHAATYLREHTFAAAEPETPQQQPQQQGAEEAHPSTGTGFFIGPNGLVLTSNHVIEGASRIGCRTGDGAVHDATVVRLSQLNDLALLRVDFRPTHYLGFAPHGSLHPGERVFTIGYGAVNFLGFSEPRFTEGAISALSGPDAEDSWMQITVPIQPGNSGGPVVNESGQVVGIIAAFAATERFMQVEGGALPQSINWAVKADYATPLLPPQPPAPVRTRAQAIALTHDSVCLIIALRGRDPRR